MAQKWINLQTKYLIESRQEQEEERTGERPKVPVSSVCLHGSTDEQEEEEE